jgi:ABC-2 type transport system ATP-binding protein
MTTPKNRTVEAVANGSREPVAVLHNVSRFFKSYQVRALTEASFDVRRSEVLGVLGPNGSGKSTALKILAGQLRPTEGSVKVFDLSPWRSSVKARISYLPGTANEPVAAGWKSFFQRFFSAKQRTGNGSTDQFTSAMSRRNQLTSALAKNADLVILNEPFAGLDPASTQEVKALIRSLVQRGRTVVLSSDSLSDVGEICDRLVIFFEGKVQAAGTLDQLLAMPDAIRFTAPVLPSTTSQRVLQVIREEISGNRPSTPENSNFDSSNSSEKSPQAEPAVTATATATETILTSLLKSNTPAAATAPLPESRKTVVDPVNHRKLAELTKPVDASSPAKPL